MKWTVCLLASLLLAAVQCQVLDIRMHPTPGDTYCGNLQCVANSSLPVIGLTIYDITEKDNPVKLVSILIFAPELSIEQSQIHVINAAGAISKYEGILSINFTKAADCLYGSFQCELEFVDSNGTPDVLKANLIGATEQNVLDIRMHPTPGDTYCGNLQCVANSSLPVIGLTIYDITEKDNPVKLVSILIFAPELSIEQSQIHVINAAGAISKYEGILSINFTKAADCLYGSFQCELEFVDSNGTPDVLKANLIGATEQNATVMYMLAEIVTQLKALQQDNQLKALQQDNQLKAIQQDNQLKALQQDNQLKALQQDNQLKALQQDNQLKALQQDNEVLKAMLGELLNLTLNTQHDQPFGSVCYRDMPHKNAREKFILNRNVLALCDTETDGGGWVVIQRRVRGDVDFYRGWDDYKRGFGTPDTDFWIGNDIIHNLTSRGYNELRIDFVYNATDYFAQYTNFSVADETSNYRITISGYSGNTYDSMAFHNGASFSTPDRNNDLDSNSCSVMWGGSWWYTSCYRANLNGVWAATDNTGIGWLFDSTDHRRPLTFTEMKIRHI